MKTTVFLPLILVCFFLTSCSERIVSSNELDITNDTFYYKGTHDPYTGIVKGVPEPDDNIAVYYEGKIINGLQEGKWTYWIEDSFKSDEGLYVNGKRAGLWTIWDYKDKSYQVGKYNVEERMDSMWIQFDSTGKKIAFWRYNEGNLEDITTFYPNGKIKSKCRRAVDSDNFCEYYNEEGDRVSKKGKKLYEYDYLKSMLKGADVEVMYNLLGEPDWKGNAGYARAYSYAGVIKTETGTRGLVLLANYGSIYSIASRQNGTVATTTLGERIPIPED